MKKLITIFSLILISLNSISVVSAREVPRKSDGSIDYSEDDVVLVKSSGTEIMSLAGIPITISEVEPTEDELISHANTKYFVDSENSYLIYFDTLSNEVLKRDFKLNILYIWDMDKNKVYDYETGEELDSVINGYNPEDSEYPITNWHYSEKSGCWVGIQPEDSNPQVLGDINFDGIVDITDLSKLSIAIVDKQELPSVWKKLADVDGDGEVNLADLARMRQYVSKVIEAF